MLEYLAHVLLMHSGGLGENQDEIDKDEPVNHALEDVVDQSLENSVSVS